MMATLVKTCLEKKMNKPKCVVHAIRIVAFSLLLRPYFKTAVQLRKKGTVAFAIITYHWPVEEVCS